MNRTRFEVAPHGVVTLLACLALCACGGGDDTSEPSETPIATLLADDGSAMPSDPRAVPADPAASTRSGRYATALQADQLERALGDTMIRVDVGCCAADAGDAAVKAAHDRQAAAMLPRSAPVLVRGAQARVAATVADRLDAAGFANVWLVTR